MMSDFSWLTVTFSSGLAIYRSNGHAGSILFVAIAYLDLVALFACLRAYERLDRHSPRRETVKSAVWVLTTFLTVMFSYKVAEVMPLAVKAVVWAMDAATTSGSFYGFFIHDHKQNQQQQQSAQAAAERACGWTLATARYVLQG